MAVRASEDHPRRRCSRLPRCAISSTICSASSDRARRPRPTAGLGLDARADHRPALATQFASRATSRRITQVGVRLDLMQTALSQFTSVTQQAQSTILQSQYQLAGGSQTQDQKNTAEHARLARSACSTPRRTAATCSPAAAVDQVPVAITGDILNGDGTQGRADASHQRAQAGRSRHQRPRPRLVVGAPSATATSLTEDAVSPFGFKLVGVTTAIAGATVTPPAGAPAVDVGRSRRGQSESPATPSSSASRCRTAAPSDLTLTATTSSPAGAGQFTIGATSGGHRDQSAGRADPGTRHARQHPAGGGVGGPGRQRFLQHRCHASSAARRRSAVRHCNDTGGRHCRTRSPGTPATTPPTIRARRRWPAPTSR